jgi:hypothetical protein
LAALTKKALLDQMVNDRFSMCQVQEPGSQIEGGRIADLLQGDALTVAGTGPTLLPCSTAAKGAKEN